MRNTHGRLLKGGSKTYFALPQRLFGASLSLFIHNNTGNNSGLKNGGLNKPASILLRNNAFASSFLLAMALVWQLSWLQILIQPGKN